MFLKDALEACPELQLRCGEDLAVYRKYSAAVTATLAASGCPVERLGMDENWVDVSKLVTERMKTEQDEPAVKVDVNVIGGSLSCSLQGCGCNERLQVGVQLFSRESLNAQLFFSWVAPLRRSLQPRSLSSTSSPAVLGFPTISCSPRCSYY